MSRKDLTQKKSPALRRESIHKLLAELNQDITSLEIASLLRKITENVRDILKVDVCDISIVERETWKTMAISGIDPGSVAPSRPKTIHGRLEWIIDNRKPLIIPDGNRETNLLPGPTVRALECRGYLGVPMLSRSGKVAGVIRALTYQPRDFTQRQVNLIQQFANGAAIALDNARLLQEMTAKNKEIESVNFRLGQLLAEQNALREIFTGINLLDLDALLRQLAEHAAKLLSADHIVVRLLNKQGALETVALVGEGAESLRDQVLISGTRRSTWVIENRRPLAIRDISQDKIFGPGHLMRAMGVKGYLCFPLISRDRKPIGTLQVTTLTEREFQQDEIILAQQFASVAAIAIENARLYEEVQQKSQELEDAFKAKTAFLNTMAHELRTPLNVMVGTQQLILDGVYGEVSEEAKKGLKVIGRQAFTMVQLINEILDLARVEAGGVSSDVDNFPIEEILIDLQSDFAPLVKEKGLNLEMKVDNPPLRLNTNKQKMKEILQNLLLNAVKYTDRGEIKVRACALFGAPESGDKGGRLCITIEDTGIGISETDLPYIFDPFYMVQGVDRRKYPSTGLGLTIVKRLVELLHGDVRVESKLGKGSTFSVLLPVLLPTESRGGTSKSSSPTG